MPRIGHFRLPANKDKGVNIYTFVYYNRYHVYAQADKLWHYCTIYVFLCRFYEQTAIIWYLLRGFARYFRTMSATLNTIA